MSAEIKNAEPSAFGISARMARALADPWRVRIPVDLRRARLRAHARSGAERRASTGRNARPGANTVCSRPTRAADLSVAAVVARGADTSA